MYPRENAKLAEQILSLGGALISEFPIGTFAAPQNLPIRNRIISGLSVGVLVLEAVEYRGTRITARCAVEQSHEVYAVPVTLPTSLSWGPNTLIKQGAKLAATWEDGWEELPSEVLLHLESEQSVESNKPETASLFDGAALHLMKRRFMHC
jgi:DNA processing protein